MTFRAINIGDLHLTDQDGKGGLSNYLPEPDKYVMSEVQRVIDWARKKGVTVIYFAGDICDNGRMSYEGMTAFTKCIRKNKDIDFVAYLGNHDKDGRDSDAGHSMQIIEMMKIKNLRVITEDTYLDYGKTKVKVCPWPSTAFDSGVLNFGHTEVYGSKGDSGREMNDDGLTKSKAVTLMGHLHTPHRVRNTYYVGTLYQTNFGEPEGKGFQYIEWNSVDDHEITQIPFKPTYRLLNCVVESQEDIKALSKDPCDLIKLVVKDGADVVVPDSPNIVITKVFKTKTDLVNILTEDLMQGTELELRSADFFKGWLETQMAPEHVKKRARILRKRLLTGAQNDGSK